jgi:phosphoglycolate phosphatase
MSVFDLIIFDYDGTLFHTQPAIVNSIKSTFAHYKLAVPSDDLILKTIESGVTLTRTFSDLNNELHEADVLQEMAATYRTVYQTDGQTYISPYDGIVPTLRKLRDVDIACVIVSNKGIDAIRHSLQAHQLSDIVRFVVGDQPDIPKKPNPVLLTEYVLPRFEGIRRDRILMVGDTEADINFAINANISSCWARYGYGHPGNCSVLEPNYRIDHIGELLDIAGAL